MTGLQILGTGRSLPRKVLTNDDMRQFVDTSDEWITSRTGIHTRHLCQEETCTTLAAQAGQKALEAAGLSPKTSAFALWPPSLPSGPPLLWPAWCRRNWDFSMASLVLT